eukprot:2360725-Rhodomonas_salina.3
MQVFIFEFLATLVIGLVFMAVRDEKRSQAGNAGPLAIGLAYSIGMFAAGPFTGGIRSALDRQCLVLMWVMPFTGGSMNPARTLGPALAFGKFDHVMPPVLSDLPPFPLPALRLVPAPLDYACSSHELSWKQRRWIERT